MQVLLVLHCLLEFAQILSIELVMLSKHLILFHSLLLLPSIFPSIKIFYKWPKYWSFRFGIIHLTSSEYSGLIFWLDLRSVQETFKTLLQYLNLKASVLQHSAFFMVQLSHLYIITGKTIPLTIWTFVGNTPTYVLYAYM